MSIIQWLKRLLGLGGGATAFLGASSISDAKDTGHAVYSLATDPVALMGLAAFVVAVGVALLTEHFLLAAARDGRYVPSGWVADALTEFAGWTGGLADEVAPDTGG